MFYILRIAFITLLVVMLHGSVIAATGGMYFDNLSVRNNTSAVFTENFDSDNLKGWSQLQDVSLAPRQGQSGHCLYINRHNPNRLARAYYQLNIEQAGIVEISTEVYLPAVEEQYNWTGSKAMSTMINLYSGNSDDSIIAGVELCPGHQAYRVRVQEVKSTEKNKSPLSCSSQDVIQPGKWVRITLQVDHKARTAALLLDSKQVARTSYTPEQFESIKGVALQGDLGDWGK